MKKRRLKPGEAIPKILVVPKETAEFSWNKHLPSPLKEDEKVIVDSNQKEVEEGYIRVKHGTPKRTSIFNKYHFVKL